MKEDKDNNISFVLFMLAVLILSIVYFSVSERVVFLENQIEWWSEFWDLVKTLGE
ncbi:hypothetical protein BMS3Abin10_02072 [bacterium BMS3Abin10]|nr:hypothetical protein BMS3Abin10_02072 [bacterium BMS3Abin10]GBE37994.1 hypothetical protein BMS3Bbin08_00593 [bacterium BMS3Bbin08]